MKMHRMVVYVIDFEDDGENAIISEIEDSIEGAKVEEVDTADIGEWHDEHELNYSHCGSELTHAKYFMPKCVGSMSTEINDMKEAAYDLAGWLSAALDDPNVCQEFKDDINEWFNCSMPYPPKEF